MINLFTTYYNEKNPKRADEYKKCILNNIKNNLITNIYALTETENNKLIDKSEIKRIKLSDRPNFNDFFNAINLYSSDNDINIISNSDIYFDHTLKYLNSFDLSNYCLALTRWDIWSDGRARLTEVEGSQDSWIFKGKVVGVKGDFYIGKPGSDNRLAYEIKRGGYIVANPSISIKSYHLHISNYRPNSNQWFVSGKFVNPPYLNVMPETIETIMYSGISLLINIIGNKRKFSDYMYSKKIKNWYKYKYYNKESKRMANSHSFRNILTNVKIKLILAYYRLPLPKLLLMIISPIYYKRNIKR